MSIDRCPVATSSIEDVVADYLAQVEEQLVAATQADTEFVTDAAQHIIASGGKRFRPALVALAAHLFGEFDHRDLIRAALVVELTHVASLYHDDVMDEAAIRRGAPSANALWDNTVAILVGDFLFARASDTVAELGPEYVSLQAKTFARLVQGQIAETVGPAPGQDPLQFHLDVIAGKTGSLISTSAVFGGMVGGADEESLAALDRFGEEIGVVFQLSDDIIDITSDETGKTPGTDLREGIPTLPTLLLAASNDPADQTLKDLLASDLSSDEALAAALTALRNHRVMDEARAEVAHRAEIARSYLAPLPECEAKDALGDMCGQIVTRTS